MASLKEVKTRIASVRSTRKITAAMKMVASSKLHRASGAIENMRPYEERIEAILVRILGSLESELDSPYSNARPVQRVALVLFTSNSSLCGGFNGNAIKAFRKSVAKHRADGHTIVEVYCFGKKGLEAARKDGFANAHDLSELNDHSTYDEVAAVADRLMQLFVAEELDSVELIYFHYKSAGSQVLTEDSMLPLVVEHAQHDGIAAANYIVEPSIEEVVEVLIPRMLRLKLYTALLDSLASEHAARVIAMQVATDNADELLRSLTLTYNKTRQQAITAELLDIIGGSMQ